MRKIFVTLVMLVMLMSVTAQTTFTSGGINYKATSDSTVEVASGGGYRGSIVIPSTVVYLDVTFTVTSIGELAFNCCSSLTSITIPSSVKSIGYRAFDTCTGLTSITIPSSVTSIGYDAFYYCTGLTSITIPSSVTSIRERAFFYCIGLTSITIPSSVTSIGESAFCSCTGLTSINIPTGLTSIGAWAFTFCSGLTSLAIPSSVTSIGESAFARCTSLTSITIPSSVTSIGELAFYDCTGLSEIHCQMEVPLPISSTVFENIDKNTCKLYAPKGSYSSYREAPVWGDFANIIETIPTFSINSSSNSDGTVAASSTSVKEGESVTFTFTPNQGYEVISATFNGKDIFSEISNNTYTVSSVGEDIVLVVTFGVIPPYGITATYNSGGNVYINDSVAISGNTVLVNKNNSVTFEIEAKTGYTIEKVLLNNQDITSQIINNSYVVSSIIQDIAFNVTFKMIAFTTTVSTSEGGKATLSSQSVDYGNSVKLTITPDEGYLVDKVTMNGTDITDSITNNAYTATAIKTNIEFVVVFKMNTAISQTQIKNLKVYAEQSDIVVKGINIGDAIDVYTTMGTLIKTIKATSDVRINVPSDQIYLVKIGSKTFKVVLWAN